MQLWEALRVLLLAQAAGATKIYVKNSGSDETGTGSTRAPMKTVQKAVDASVDGDTIMLFPGAHKGAVVLKDKQLTITAVSSLSVTSIVPFPDVSGPVMTFEGGKLTISKIKIAGGEVVFKRASIIFERVTLGTTGMTVLEGCAISFTQAAFDGDKQEVTHSGAAVHIKGGSARFVNCTMKNGVTTRHGGAIAVEGGEARITNCTMSDNRAGSAGGALYVDGGTITVKNSVFINNQAMRGGAVFVSGDKDDPTHPFFRNCMFEGNRAVLGGAALTAGSTQTNFENCTMSGNVASTGGGAIACILKSQPRIENCTLLENFGKKGGGLMIGDNAAPAIRNTNLTSNQAQHGGGMLAEDEAVPGLVNVTFLSNNATSGGAFYLTDSVAGTIDDTNVVRNRAIRYGGGYYADYNAATMFRGVHFSWNTCKFGMAFYKTPTVDLHFEDCSMYPHEDQLPEEDLTHLNAEFIPERNLQPVKTLPFFPWKALVEHKGKPKEKKGFPMERAR